MQGKILREVRRRIRGGGITWAARNAALCLRVAGGAIAGRTLGPPVLAGLFVTYRCNAACAFCDLPRRSAPSSELSTDSFRRAIDEFHAMGTPAVGFAGGEPLLRPDLWDLVRHAADLGLTTSLESNGLLWSEETIGRLFDSGLGYIGFSLESDDPVTHDRLFGRPGSWEKTCGLIRRIAEARRAAARPPVITVHTCLSLANLDRIASMPAFVADLGADQLNVMGFEAGAIRDKDPGVRDALDLARAGIDRVDGAVEALARVKRETGRVDNSFDSLEAIRHQARGKPLPVRCLAAQTSFYIDPAGRLFSCLDFLEEGRLSCGRYEPGRLKETWYSAAYEEFRARHLAGCRRCYWPCQNELNYLFNPRRYIPGLSRFPPP